MSWVKKTRAAMIAMRCMVATECVWLCGTCLKWLWSEDEEELFVGC